MMSSFHITSLGLLCVFLVYGAINPLDAYSAEQPYRTAFHFQPHENYMNDPNGPMFYRGIYHLFYQFNPIGHGSMTGPRIWGHATSRDLVNWVIQPNTLNPQMPANNGSSLSGSATMVLGYKPVLIFTGQNAQNQEVQNIAVPKNLLDPYLKEWVLIPQNPVMFPTPENKIDPTNFRDPTTAWILPDGRWRVAVGSADGSRGLAMLFTSKDFVNWVQSKEPLYSQDSGVWECPDFYPVYHFKKLGPTPTIGADTSTIGPFVKHVLKVSLITNYQSLTTKHDVYTIGMYDIKKDAYISTHKFVNDSGLRYDYGNYYASKTFYDPSRKRRILFAWVKESISDAATTKNGWAGIQAIPRSIWLDSSGKQLIQWPVRELETLRGWPVRLPCKVIKGGSISEIPGITPAQADVEMSFKIKNMNLKNCDTNWTKDPQILCTDHGPSVKGAFGPFGLLTLASEGLEEFTAVYFKIFNANNKPVVLMCSDQRRSSLNPDTEKHTYGSFVDVDPVGEDLFLKVLIDHSVVESFAAKGKNVITARVYPTLAIGDKTRLYVFNNGTNDVEYFGLTAWSMKTARIV